MPRLSPVQRAELVLDFTVRSHSLSDVCRKYGVSDAAARGLIRRRGHVIPKAHIKPNDGVFDVLGAESLYWLGFLFSDGCIDRTRPHLIPSISVGLSLRDVEHIEKLRTFVGTNGAISISESRGSEGVAQFSFRSQRLVDRMIALGFYGELASELAGSPDFWRGAVDADGSIGSYGRPARPQFRLFGRSPIVRACANFLERRGVSKMTVRPHKSIFCIGTTGGAAASAIHLLYPPNACAYLERKFVAAREIRETERLRQSAGL